MLMYIFNQELFWYIQIISSTLVGALIVGGAIRTFTCDQFFKDNKNKEGRKRIFQGSILLILGFSLCYGWIVLRDNDFFKHFENETYGTPTFLVEKRIKDKEDSKRKIEEIKKQNLEKEKAREAKRKQKALEKQSQKDDKTTK